MNILYVCADWGIPIRGEKGASVHVREFVNTLDRIGHHVLLLFASGGTGNPTPHAQLIELPPEPSTEARVRQAARLGIDVDPGDKALRRELDKLAYDEALPTRAIAWLQNLDLAPDVVYERFSLFQQGGAAIASALDIPYVLEVNAPLLEEEERHRILKLKHIARAIERRCFHSATHIVCVSQSLKGYIESAGVSPARVSCLPNGVDTRRFNPSIDPGPVRRRYALEDRPIIGFVGSLKPWHGLTFLFEAMCLLGTRNAKCRLMVVGDGPEFRNAAKRVNEPGLKGRIVLTGSVPHDEVPAHLAAMDLTVAPYAQTDSFYFSPLKVVESLAAGRPVVAPGIGQLNDLIQDGITGLLYPPGDMETFVSHMDRLASDPALRGAMAEQARRDAVDRMSWDRVVEHAARIMMQGQQAA